MPKEEKQENSEKKVAGEDGVAEKRPGIITGEEIEQLGLVDPPSEECLRATSYDLKLGPELFVCGKKKPKFINLEEKGLKGITIESFGTIIFSTREKIDLSKHKNIVGRFGLKIGRGLDGLILQVGPQVEPGYKGPLFGVLLNTRGEGKTIMLDERFLAIEFSRTSSIPSNDLFDKNVKEINSLYEFLIKSQHINPDHLARPSVIQKVRDELRAYQERHKIKTERDDRKTIKRTLIWTIIGVAIAILLGLYNAFGDKIFSRFRQGESFDIQAVKTSALDGTGEQGQPAHKNEDRTGSFMADKNNSTVVAESNETKQEENGVSEKKHE